MAKIFLSYSRHDVENAESLANALESRDHCVWWDRQVQGGSRFSVEIERELKGSDAVIVMWSGDSVQSAWVQDEAAEGRDRGRLIPIAIDGSRPPIGFRQFQVIDLSHWSGRPEAAEIDEVHNSILAITGRDKVAPVRQPRIPKRRGHRPGKAWTAVLAIAAIAMVALLAWASITSRNPYGSPLHVQLAKFSALTPDVPPSAPQALREELLAALATDAMVSATDAKADAGTRSGFIVEASIRRLADSLRFTIHLRNAQSGNEIWTASMEKPARIADIAPRQVAVGLSQVLRCGLGGAATYPKPIPDQTLSLYFNYCEVVADIQNEGPNSTRAMDLARRLTKLIPDFSYAWSGLALQAGFARDANTLVDDKAIVAEARAAAKKALALDGNNSEAYQALAELEPGHAYAAREKLLQKAISVRPSDCGCEYVGYGILLAVVGRSAESVDSLKRAHDMLPLRADVNASWAEALYIAERPDEGEAVIGEVSELWPDYGYVDEILVRSAFWTGRYDRALERLSGPALPLSTEERAAVGLALKGLKDRHSPSVNQARAQLLALAARPSANLAVLVPAIAATGGGDEALAIVDRAVVNGRPITTYLLFEPSFARARQAPRFAEMVRRYGLVNYWRQSGHSPDFCKEASPPALCKTL